MMITHLMLLDGGAALALALAVTADDDDDDNSPFNAA
jgi:hypothetical protein